MDKKEYFEKWKSRLAAQGQHQEPGIDCVWNTFSPTLGFAAIKTLASLMCDPTWIVDSYDLLEAFLGTKLEDREVYIRLPPEAGKHANKILRLEKSSYGLKSVSKAFMKKLGEEVLKFVERVEYKSPGDINVDDICCRTTDRDLRERFFDHLRKRWAIWLPVDKDNLVNYQLVIRYRLLIRILTNQPTIRPSPFQPTVDSGESVDDS